MTDARERLLEWAERIESIHTPEAPFDEAERCRACLTEWVCDAARAAAVIRAMVKNYERWPSGSVHDMAQGARYVIQAGAAALEE